MECNLEKGSKLGPIGKNPELWVKNPKSRGMGKERMRFVRAKYGLQQVSALAEFQLSIWPCVGCYLRVFPFDVEFAHSLQQQHLQRRCIGFNWIANVRVERESLSLLLQQRLDKLQKPVERRVMSAKGLVSELFEERRRRRQKERVERLAKHLCLSSCCKRTEQNRI